MDKLKKMTSYRLFWPIVCLALVLLFNLIKSPSFFEISIKNGVLYGYLVDIFNRSSELIILAVGMTLCVASSAGTDISVGAIMALSGAVSVYLLGSGETDTAPDNAMIRGCICLSSWKWRNICNSLDRSNPDRACGICIMWYVERILSCEYEDPANGSNIDLIYRRTRNGTVDHRWK